MDGLEGVLKKWGEENMALAVALLGESKKSVSGTLADSLRFEVRKEAEDLFLTLYEADYGKFVRLGVRGAQGSSKAPMSPFKYTTKFPPPAPIDQWVVRKNLTGTRDAKGRFIPRKTLTFLIRRSIFRFGIRPFNYFRPFRDNIKDLTGYVSENQKQEILLLIESTLNADN